MPEKFLKWSDRALKETQTLTDYLLNHWSDKIALRVIRQISKSAQRILQTPENFPVVLEKKKVRRCVLSPQTSIFFKVDKTEIIILSVFDNRQNPKKRKL